mgnify:CR=1 FL=1
MNTADYFNRMAEKWDTMFKTDTGVINHILDKADIEPDNIICLLYTSDAADD